MTGQYDDHILQRAKTPNTYGYIIKPFSSNDLISNIEIALFNHSSEEQPREPERAAFRETKQDTIVKPAVQHKKPSGLQPHTTGRAETSL